VATAAVAAAAELPSAVTAAAERAPAQQFSAAQ